jgi:hypothetical protein
MSFARHLATMRPPSWKANDIVFGYGVSSYESLKKDVVAAGIEPVDELGRGLGFHTFRRTFITLGHKFGLAPRVVQQLARHRSATMTNNVYTDTTKLELHSAVEKLSVLLGNTGEALPRPLPLFSGQNAVLVSTNGHPDGQANGKIPAQTIENEPLSPPVGFVVQNWEGCSGRDLNPSTVATEVADSKDLVQKSESGLPRGLPLNSGQLTPELARIVQAWPSLPESLRGAILSIVGVVEKVNGVGGGL